MDEQLIPQLRFPAFDLEYKKVELKKIATFNPKSEELPESFIYIDLESVKNGLLAKEERINKSDAPSRAQRLLRKDDIIYQTVRPYQRNNYFFNKNATDYVASTGYAQIRTNQVSQYLYQYLHTEKFVNKVLVRCTGTSYPAINSTDLSKININIPSLPEQQKIASFLSDVDNKITKLTKKKALLEQYKKGVMQKIFNQELRFKDDNGNEFPEWEEKTLGDTFIFKQGFQFGVEEQSETYFKGSVEFIRIINVTSDKNDKRYVLDPGKEHHINSEDLFMVRYGDAGRVAKGFTGIIANNMFRLLPKFEINKLFFFYCIGRLYNKIHSLSGSSTMPAISFGTIDKIKISIPSMKEQFKIANFLSDIDVKIEAINTKIENSKAFKKGLLQKMFV